MREVLAPEQAELFFMPIAQGTQFVNRPATSEIQTYCTLATLSKLFFSQCRLSRETAGTPDRDRFFFSLDSIR
jgi:hypothetical protein